MSSTPESQAAPVVEKSEEKKEQPKEEKSAKEEKAAPKEGKKSEKGERQLTAKEKRLQERAAAEEKKKQEASSKKEEPVKMSGTNFGILPMNQSTSRSGKTFLKIHQLEPSKATQKVLVRGRVHVIRPKSGSHSVQAVLDKDNAGKEAIAFVSKAVTKESIVEVEGTVTLPKDPLVRRQLDDLARPQAVLEQQEREMEGLTKRIAELRTQIEQEHDAEKKKNLEKELAAAAEKKEKGPWFVDPNQDTRLNNRVVDLRTPTNLAIFRVQGAVCRFFREYLDSQGFTEIHTPKIIPAASEGGANVFKVSYFGGSAFLAQSPQLYKQMAICSDFERVYEVGPVFRAEKAFTHRHLTEFVGLDLEMVFEESYEEVLDVMEGLFVHMFRGLETKHAEDLKTMYFSSLSNLIISSRQQYPSEPISYLPKGSDRVLRLTFPQGIALLREAGVDAKKQPDLEDLSTETEKKLGAVVKVLDPVRTPLNRPGKIWN